MYAQHTFIAAPGLLGVASLISGKMMTSRLLIVCYCLTSLGQLRVESDCECVEIFSVKWTQSAAKSTCLSKNDSALQMRKRCLLERS